MESKKVKRCNSDLCVYFKKEHNQEIIYLFIYVDDMLIVSRDQVQVQRLKAGLKQEFEMKYNGKL